MNYPSMDQLERLGGQLELYAQLKTEYGSRDVAAILKEVEKTLAKAVDEIKGLPVDPEMAKREPNGLAEIRALRPQGPRRLWRQYNQSAYLERLEGALLGRFAGCTLGAPVEGWPVAKIKSLAEENGQAFPPTDYWSYVPEPARLRYELSPRSAYTRNGMQGVPVDDDVAYTLLGLLVVEDYGPEFTIAQNGEAWLKYLPYACTAEDVALRNLKAGVPAERAAENENPFCEWIGADIRSDPWGYMAPGWPERAADMAYRDAYLSHRRQGIYGEMYFSAVIAAAFAVDHPVEALEIGLSEIPQECRLAREVRWALKMAPQIVDYAQARAAVDERFAGMHPVHTINNACLTIWGLTIGGTDLTRVLAETVAMGLDNDCTAATAGSIAGAVVGKQGVEKHWYVKFDDTVYAYLIDRPRFSIGGLVERFATQARGVHENR
jgi:ADP-ribosylglycohydrolase